jgi:formate C-acetyltransferase
MPVSRESAQAGAQSGEFGANLSPRLEQLRRDVMVRKGSWVAGANPFERDVALWRAQQGFLSVVQMRARLLLELVKLAKIAIPPGWRLAGEHLSGHAFGLSQEVHCADVGRMQEFGLRNEEITEVQTCYHRHVAERGHMYSVGASLGDVPRANAVYRGWGWIENHSIRDYAKVLRIGYEGIQRNIRKCMSAARLDDPDYPRKENFWCAALWVCEAGCLLGQRYAELAERMAVEAQDPEDRMRLAAMAEACRRVPVQGARTLFEATQALWMAHVLTCGEDGINANSIGRLDQILGPYYEDDLASGRVTREDAVVLMEELACKLYLEYDVQAITLGGLTRDGEDASNEMSRIILEATRNVGFVRDVSVRIHSKTAAWLVRCAAEVAARGGGIPFFFNDECFIPALVEHGIAIDDARDYAPIGCIELTIPGRANPHAVSGWFNAAKCLELALFDGRDPRTGEQLGPSTGLLTDFDAYEALYDAYRKQVEHFTARMVYHCNRGELMQREWGPLPCWSILTDDCIERGRDITDGGAIYNYHSVCFLGTANTADGLCALKKLVFEKKAFRAQELLDAVRANFDGYETLRQRLLHDAPKYGNDVEDVDGIARGVAEDFIGLMDSARSPLGGRYFVHLFSFVGNIDFGKETGATPDGRRAAEPLAYSLSAHQGRDREGVTALIKSLSRLPHDRAAGASAAIVDLDPKLVEGVEGSRRLEQLLLAAFKMGVGQLQFNVTTAERLRQAQHDPERYGNISVRVAGYSQMFRLLTKDLQDHVIARTKHTQ